MLARGFRFSGSPSLSGYLKAELPCSKNKYSWVGWALVAHVFCICFKLANRAGINAYHINRHSVFQDSLKPAFATSRYQKKWSCSARLVSAAKCAPSRAGRSGSRKRKNSASNAPSYPKPICRVIRKSFRNCRFSGWRLCRKRCSWHGIWRIDVMLISSLKMLKAA